MVYTEVILMRRKIRFAMIVSEESACRKGSPVYQEGGKGCHNYCELVDMQVGPSQSYKRAQFDHRM